MLLVHDPEVRVKMAEWMVNVSLAIILFQLNSLVSQTRLLAKEYIMFVWKSFGFCTERARASLRGLRVGLLPKLVLGQEMLDEDSFIAIPPKFWA